jgi:hypothetical protein
MSRKSGVVLLMIAGAAGCPGQVQDVFERLRKSFNHVDDADVTRTGKNIEWARLYFGKTWNSLMSSAGFNYQPPYVIDGGRTAFSGLPSKCKGTAGQDGRVAKPLTR